MDPDRQPRSIAADRETVLARLTTRNTLKAAIPAAKELTGSPEDGFEAVVKQKGRPPVKATFKGQVTLQDLNPPESYTLVGEGKGGVAGFAKGSAAVTLTPVEDGTRLDYEVHAQVGGKLAQLGSRIIGGFARKMADAFFENFKGAVEGGEDDPAA